MQHNMENKNYNNNKPMNQSKILHILIDIIQITS